MILRRKPIFDAVRKMLGRSFTQAEVDVLDAAIDQTDGNTPTGEPATTAIGPAGIALIKQFEGCARRRPDGLIEAYPDPGTGGEPWTIGWGATHMDGRKVRRGDVITQERADALLDEHLSSYAAEVAKVLGDAPTTQTQFDALVSFHYNTGAIGRATLTKMHKAGKFGAAAEQFARWVNAGGKVMRGLVRRRAAEAALYRGEG